MSTKHMTMTAEGMAWMLTSLMERNDSESRRVAGEQILKLCQFYYAHQDLKAAQEQEKEEKA